MATLRRGELGGGEECRAQVHPNYDLGEPTDITIDFLKREPNKGWPVNIILSRLEAMELVANINAALLPNRNPVVARTSAGKK